MHDYSKTQAIVLKPCNINERYSRLTWLPFWYSLSSCYQVVHSFVFRSSSSVFATPKRAFFSAGLSIRWTKHRLSYICCPVGQALDPIGGTRLVNRELKIDNGDGGENVK